MQFTVFTVNLFRNQAKFINASFLCIFYAFFSPLPVEGGFIVSPLECMQPHGCRSFAKNIKTLTPEVGSKGFDVLMQAAHKKTILGDNSRRKGLQT
jgi:hypothetical protein